MKSGSVLYDCKMMQFPIDFKSPCSCLQPAVVHLQGQGSAIQVKNGKDLMILAVTEKSPSCTRSLIPGSKSILQHRSLIIPAVGLPRRQSDSQTLLEKSSIESLSPFHFSPVYLPGDLYLVHPSNSVPLNLPSP